MGVSLMIRLELLNNTDKFKPAIMKDDLYKSISPELNLEKVDFCNTLYFLANNENNQSLGILILQPFSPNCLQFHGGVYKEFRGRGRLYIKEVIQIVKDAYNVQLVSTTYESNRPARNILKKLGFIEKTIIYDGYLNGNLVLFAER